MQRQASPNIVIALVGNKIDLAATAREVATAEAQAYASESSLLFMEASAKTGENVAECFTEIGIFRSFKISKENTVGNSDSGKNKDWTAWKCHRK